jgi:hypothetical protein
VLYAASLIAFVLAVLEFGSMFVPGVHDAASAWIACGTLFVLAFAFAIAGRWARVWSSSV